MPHHDHGTWKLFMKPPKDFVDIHRQLVPLNKLISFKISTIGVIFYRCIILNYSHHSWHGRVYFNIWKNYQWTIWWKHVMKGPKLLSHCIVFPGSHIWTSTMSLFWRIFTMFLQIMVGQNPNKSNFKKHFLI